MSHRLFLCLFPLALPALACTEVPVRDGSPVILPAEQSDGLGGLRGDDAGLKEESDAQPDQGTPSPDLAAPSPDTRPPQPDIKTNPNDPYDRMRALCVKLINQYRATKGVPALTRYPEKESCADQQCVDDGKINVAHATRGRCGESNQAQFVGMGYGAEELTRESLQDMWNEGPGGPHYEMMASPRYTKVACGYAQTPAGLWGVQDYY